MSDRAKTLYNLNMVKMRRYTSPMPKSALRYVLEGLIPYTEANLKLAFKPSMFFDELDRLSSRHTYSRSAISQAYYRAKSEGYIELQDGMPILTTRGEQALQPHIPKIIGDSCVMVIFDIPEEQSVKRRYLRMLLRELKFVQIQKSVWTSNYDCANILEVELRENQLAPYVQLFESARIL